LYQELQQSGVNVLFDDRDVRPGEKFADADLMGIPVRVVISAKTLAEDSVEVKLRSGSDAEMMKLSEVTAYLSGAVKKA